MPFTGPQLNELEDSYHYWKEDVAREGRIAIHVTRDQLLAEHAGKSHMPKAVETAKTLGITFDSKKNMIIGKPNAVYAWLTLINPNENSDRCIDESLRKSRSKWSVAKLLDAAHQQQDQ